MGIFWELFGKDIVKITATVVAANEIKKRVKEKQIENERQRRDEAFFMLPSIRFIYDTSWLMAPCDYEINIHEDYSREDIILDCVKKEIAKHLKEKDEKKKIAAGAARSLVAEIMMCKGYTEYPEKDIPEVTMKEPILGPDSQQDRLILSLANSLASEFSSDELGKGYHYDFVFILTHDGGIKTEAATLFKKHGKLVFTPASINTLNDIFAQIEACI